LPKDLAALWGIELAALWGIELAAWWGIEFEQLALELVLEVASALQWVEVLESDEPSA
jgi:hypothetical protein